jgi:DNA-binding LytR/AlgR family response regulator
VEALTQLLAKANQSYTKTVYGYNWSQIAQYKHFRNCSFLFEDKATFLITHEGLRLTIDYSLDKLTQLLNPHDFFRINRSFLVSLPAIHTAHAYSGGKLKLDLAPAHKQEVFCSGDRITDFKEWLGK